MGNYIGIWKDQKSGRVKEMRTTAPYDHIAYGKIHDKITRPSLLGNIQYPVAFRVFRLNGPNDVIAVANYKSRLKSYEMTRFDKSREYIGPLNRKQRIIKGIVDRLRD